MDCRRNIFRPGQACWAALTCLLALTLGMFSEPAQAQSRKATPQEVAAIKACVEKTKDNVDAGEQKCLFSVADKCIGDVGAAPDRKLMDCYEIEGSIWEDLLNANYKRLLDTLDDEQKVKARDMQRAWISYRDTTCKFYWDKIHGTMANHMAAACRAREAARRAMLLGFFSEF
jgi:uncharacterized protein YecT (DUF1311 family)